MSEATAAPRVTNGDANRLQPADQAVHGWYRFVLSFPPHLVREYLERFGIEAGHRGPQPAGVPAPPLVRGVGGPRAGVVLDPFCGTGTTLVECKKLGIASVGLEANSMACFASQVKVDWRPDPDGLLDHARQVAALAAEALAASGIEDDALVRPGTPPDALQSLSAEQAGLLLKDSISPLPLHKTLVLLDCLERQRDDRYDRHERLALAKALVTGVSNLQFGPEVGVGPLKPDAAVLGPWLAGVRRMAADLRQVQGQSATPALIHVADARAPLAVLAPASIDAVITSPPYPNEKDYTRTTRLESVLLGFLANRAELRGLKRTLVRSNTRSVYRGDDDDRWIAAHPAIGRIADAIEARRIELGKTSGFERQYAKVTRLYFGGMARHLAGLRAVLRPGAQLAYVVGDQASFLRVMIRTGQLLAEIAEALGYEVVGIDLFRTRLATATRAQLREEVVILRWPGWRTPQLELPELAAAVGEGW